MSIPRLGVAGIRIEISDKKGIEVWHGSQRVLLAQKPEPEVNDDDWDKLWDFLQNELKLHRELH